MRHLLTAFLSFVFCFSAFAKPIENPLLWKAQKGERVVHLFGTFHLGFSLSDLPTTVLDLVKGSDTFFMETDLSMVDPAQVQANGMYANGQSLDQFLPDDSWNELVELLSPVLPEEQLKLFEPWFVSNIISGLALQQLNLTGSLDTELLEYAKSENVELGFLEPADLQFAVLEAISPVSSLHASLVKSDNLIEDSKTELLAIHECYAKSDVDCLTQLTGSTQNGGSIEPWQYELLLSQRNKTWIPVIEKANVDSDLFVAVGAGHLVGNDSVLKLLELEGYSIERVQIQ